LFFLELTLKTHVSHIKNTAYDISSNALFGNSANNFINRNFFRDAKLLSTLDLENNNNNNTSTMFTVLHV